MIILTEVARKIEEILNDDNNPTPFEFVVETEGFHIDHIANKGEQKNFIPVFISSLGGQFNPVKGLKQAACSIPITFYYPVRFKDWFYAIGDYLSDVFVGSIINYGSVSGDAVSNISLPQYGEIQNLDFTQFRDWVNERYERTIEKMEPYMTMQLTLYLSTAAPGLIFGNSMKTKLSFDLNGQIISTDDVFFDDENIQINSVPSNEQELDTPEGVGFPFGTAIGSSIKIYPNLELEANESTEEEPIYFYQELLKEILSGEFSKITLDFEAFLENYPSIIFKRKCYIQSAIIPIQKGQILTLTLTFARLSEEDEDSEE